MKAINHIPLLRPFIPFVAGIIFAVNEEVFDINISTVIFLTIILIINNFIPYFNSNYSYRWFFGFIACICFFLLGYKITINNNLTNKENHFSRFILSNKYFIAKVSDSKTEKEKTYKIIVDVIGTYQNNKFIKTTGKSLLYIQKDMSSGNISYGDVILIKNKFKELDPPYNPHAFDYKKYLAFQNISHKCYLYSNDWEMLNQKIYNPLINHSLIARHKILSVFRQNNFRGSEYSVAASLITGYTDNLDPELVREYTSAGVIHVLAVSGMHVALIYLIISKLLFFMGNRTYEKIIKAIISILLLWFYAAITGFCPSVLRAGVMFSFIIIGTTFDKNHKIINTLIASAFLLLIINPYFIMDVGFQLSYLSVIGIVSINNQLNSIAVNRNRIIRNIISVMFVTIAAQAFVFPLSLYYFHKFPIYFLPANMIVIPVSNIIIYLAISLLFFYPIKLIGSIISFTTVKSIYLLNNFINYIDHLPHSVINNIYINTIELLILYSIVILFFIFILKRTIFSLILSLTLLLIFISERTYQSYRQIHQHKLIVYYSPKSTVIEFINGKKAELYSDTSLIKNKSRLDYISANNHAFLGISEFVINNINDNQQNHIKSLNYINIYYNFREFHNKRILQINKTNYLITSANKITVDFIIISGNPHISLLRLIQAYNFQQLIIDSSNSIRYATRLISEAKNLGINCYSVLHSGAFEADI